MDLKCKNPKHWEHIARENMRDMVAGNRDFAHRVSPDLDQELNRLFAERGHQSL